MGNKYSYIKFDKDLLINNDPNRIFKAKLKHIDNKLNIKLPKYLILSLTDNSIQIFNKKYNKIYDLYYNKTSCWMSNFKEKKFYIKYIQEVCGYIILLKVNKISLLHERLSYSINDCKYDNNNIL